MGKLLGALAVAIAVTLGAGFGGATHAYPPDGVVVTITPPTVGPGGTITIGIEGGAPGESITIVISINITIVVVIPPSGTIVEEVPAPTDPGTHRGTVRGSESGEIGFEVEVVDDADEHPAGQPLRAQLPATGSSGVPDAVRTGILLVIVGLALAFVGRSRRRAEPAAEGGLLPPPDPPSPGG